MSRSNLEKETIIIFNEAESTATCDTWNRKLMDRLDKLALSDSTFTVVERGDEYGVYTFPKKLVLVRNPRYISEEKRSELAKRAKENFGHG